MRAFLVYALLLYYCGLVQGQPILVAPDSAATFVPTEEVHLTWRSVPQATGYLIRVREIGTGHIFFDHPVADTLFTLTELTESRRYQWRVRYRIGSTVAGESETWWFSTRYGPPGVVSLMTPADGSEVGVYILDDSTSVAFRWAPHGDPETVTTQILTDSLFAFRVQVADEPSFTGDLIQDVTLSCYSHGITCWNDRVVAELGQFSVNQTYYWRVQQQNRAGVGAWSATWSFTTVHVVSNEVEPPSTDLIMLSNHPNPFKGRTTIEYSLAEPGMVSLKVFTATGAEVLVLVDGFNSSGTHRIDWDATGLASGQYIYQLQAHGKTVTRRMILIR